MSMTDPIADMLTRIRNAINRRHASVDIPHSKMKESIAQILQDEGFIQRYEIVPDGRFQAIRVHLKYAEGRRPVLTHLTIAGGMGIVIVSTPRGVLTGTRARRENVGGELICEVW